MVVQHAWYPLAGHPSGPTAEPWYRSDIAFVYPAEGHPLGMMFDPVFRIADGLVYALDVEEEAVFAIRGSFVYPAYLPGSEPWFQIR